MGDYEKLYEEFWKSIVENQDGSINKDALMRELSDFHDLIGRHTEVVSAVTGGMLSYANYPSKTIIRVFEDHVQEMCDEAVREYREDHPSDG